MENLLKEIYKNNKILNKGIQKSFDYFVFNVYRYNIYFQINDKLNLLQRHYGTSSKNKFKNLISDKLTVDYLFVKIFHSQYSKAKSDIQKCKIEIKEIEHKITRYTQLSKDGSYIPTQDRISIKEKQEEIKQLKKYTIPYHIKEYIEFYNKCLNGNYDKEDFYSDYFGDNEKIAKKYSEKIYKACMELYKNKNKLQKSSFEKFFKKHQTYVDIYSEYLKLSKKLKNINEIEEIDYSNYIRKNLDIISNSFYSTVSDDAISILTEILGNKKLEPIACLYLVPYTRFFNEYDENDGETWKHLFRGKNFTLPLSMIKENIELKEELLDFNCLDEMLCIKKIK